MDTKEYQYRNLTIKMRYCPETPFVDAGWNWQCFYKGVCIAESYEDYPNAEERALAMAKEAVDTFVEAPEDDD